MRLSRPESQARTRAELIATACDLFMTDGYANTSLESVAEAAGYSKGAVYSNFRNKKELCLEVLDLIHTTKFGELREQLAVDEPLDSRIERFQRWAEKTLGDVGWTMLEFEFMVIARDDEQLHAALVSKLDAARAMATAVLDDLARTLKIELPIPAADAGISLLSLGIGLGIQRAVDPSVSAKLITDGLRLLLTVAGARV